MMDCAETRLCSVAGTVMRIKKEHGFYIFENCLEFLLDKEICNGAVFQLTTSLAPCVYAHKEDLACIAGEIGSARFKISSANLTLDMISMGLTYVTSRADAVRSMYWCVPAFTEDEKRCVAELSKIIIRLYLLLFHQRYSKELLNIADSSSDISFEILADKYSAMVDDTAAFINSLNKVQLQELLFATDFAECSSVKDWFDKPV